MAQFSFLRRLKTYGANKKAMAAVEFALIAPVLIAMLFGGAEVSQLLAADRKITQAASTLADLAAQDDALTCAEMDGLVAATQMVAQPLSATPLTLQVSSVVLSGTSPVVEWSRGIGCAVTRAPGSAGPVPANLIPNASSGIIVGEVSYTYTSGFSALFVPNMTIRKQFALLPRRSSKVCFAGVTSTGCP
jgi:Flp pilus assembly protein TadG